MLDRFVHSFDLSISLRSCDRREDLLDLAVGTIFLEFNVVELCSVIIYDGVGESVPVDDVLIDELLDLYGHDGRKHFCFNLFSEVFDRNYCILYTCQLSRFPRQKMTMGWSWT